MNSRTVYSSDGGRQTTPQRGRPARGGGKPETRAPSIPNDGVVRIFRERGKRGGKTVTVIRGLPERGTGLGALAQELRRLCGAGGTTREDSIEIQGDHRDRVAEHLTGLGFKVKLAGG